MNFTGNELLRIWEAGRPNGLSQRKMASVLGLPFNAMHGKLFRSQKKLVEPEEKTLTVTTYDRVFLKAAVFDIECMDFCASGIRGHLVSTCILPLDSDEIQTLKLEFEDNRDDRRLLGEVVKALEEYDILVGHNIASFDFNWLNTRLLYHNMPQMSKKFLYYDTYQAARRIAIKADRKSLGFLGDFFRVDGDKTSVLPVAWGMVDSPNREEFDKAMENIIYHCEQDVRLNRNIFDAMWPYDRGLQNLPMTKKW